MRKNIVSVIIPTYNNAENLGEAIDSVLNQTYKNIEVIVVDDGSVDQTDSVISEYLEKIVYIKKKNGGPGDARNKGLEYATGEYVACSGQVF